MSLYEQSVPQLKKMLTNLSVWMDTAAAHADKKKFDVNVLASARLAPDQYPLTRQIQSCCDAAKFAAARVGAKEPPKNPDTETTFDELRARIKSTIAFLDTVKSSDFEKAESRTVPLTFMEGKGLIAADYLNELALPNFYFHLVTAYSILRHNGVDIGKMVFIGSINLKDL